MEHAVTLIGLLAVFGLVYWLVLQLQIPQPFVGFLRVGLLALAVAAVLLLAYIFILTTPLGTP